jgi:hypothetical protein
MSVYKSADDEILALEVTPRKWDRVIGPVVVLVLAILMPILYLVVASIRASYAPGMS